MDRFNALGRGLQLMLVAGVLLLLVMFFPWEDFGGECRVQRLGRARRAFCSGF